MFKINGAFFPFRKLKFAVKIISSTDAKLTTAQIIKKKKIQFQYFPVGVNVRQ